MTTLASYVTVFEHAAADLTTDRFSCIFCKIVKGEYVTPETARILTIRSDRRDPLASPINQRTRGWPADGAAMQFSMKLLETDTIFAFMDIGPIARGHCLIIPKRQ